MNKITLLGLSSVVLGFFMLFLKGLGFFMEKNLTVPGLRPEDLMSDATLDNIDAMTPGLMFTITDYLITTPFYMYFIVVGIIVLIIGGMME